MRIASFERNSFERQGPNAVRRRTPPGDARRFVQIPDGKRTASPKAPNGGSPGKRSGKLTQWGVVNEGLFGQLTRIGGLHSAPWTRSARRLEELCSSAQALLFDLDGTLADTMPMHYEAWQHVLGGLGVTLDRDRYFCDGRRAHAQDPRNLDEEQGIAIDFDELVVLKERLFLEQAHRAVPLDPAFSIARFFQGKKPMAIVSGGMRRAVARTLDLIGATAFFATVVTAEDTESTSPIPSRSCSRRRGFEPTRPRASCSRTATPGSRRRAPPACRSSTYAKNGVAPMDASRLKSFVDRAWERFDPARRFRITSGSRTSRRPSIRDGAKPATWSAPSSW